MKKKVLLALLPLSFMLCFFSIQPSVADCNPGHYSTGNQDFGGPNGRWELVCDKAHSAVCCVSHPAPPEEEEG